MNSISNYLELTKPRLTGLVLVTTGMGYALAARGHVQALHLALTVIATWMVAGGAIAMNQYIERELDALMHRTQNRPLPTHRLRPEQALIFGVGLSLVGILGLTLWVNGLSAVLAGVTWVCYLYAYTPLKRRSSLCTLVGAIPGALPPLIGWAAANGSLVPEAWILFAIMFIWQLPHFLAIAWMYREDYARAGFPMLPVVDPEGGSTARMIVLYCAILIPVTLMPARLGLAGYSYFWGALGLGIVFFTFGACTAFFRTPAYARRLLLASVIYLPALFTWMALS